MKDPLQEEVKVEENKQEEAVLPTDECIQIKENLMRLTADFQNYKRRIEKDRQQWSHVAQSQLLEAILPVVDDFERALKEAKKPQEETQFTQWIEGFELIYKALESVLVKEGVTPIKEHTVFNPEFHEALVQVESEGHKEGEIVEVMQRGFMFKGKVLRPSKVSVAQ